MANRLFSVLARAWRSWRQEPALGLDLDRLARRGQRTRSGEPRRLVRPRLDSEELRPPALGVYDVQAALQHVRELPRLSDGDVASVQSLRDPLERLGGCSSGEAKVEAAFTRSTFT